jgi:shikimate dehydrogenase
VTAQATFALFGSPVGHSISPAMLGAAFRHLGLSATYRAVEVSPSQLPSAMQGAKEQGLRGLNVTLPHKVAAMAQVDLLGESAALAGALNTVVFDGGQASGHNGDLVAMTEAIAGRGLELKGKTALVLGAGGAARAAAFALGLRGARVVVANRTLTHALELANALAHRHIATEAVRLDEARRCSSSAFVIVQATSVGLNDAEAQVAPGLDFAACALACELVYRPLETAFVREARRAGVPVCDGLELLVGQGRAALGWWFPGLELPGDLPTVMRAAAEEAMR